MYLTKSKANILELIIQLCKMIKTQFDVNIKSFRTDNGREFMNSIIDTYFKAEVILNELSCVNTPQHNGDETKPRGRQFHAVSYQNNSKLTNFKKFTRIEGYNGKYGSNPQGIKEFLDVIFKFDQIGRKIDGRNWGKWYFKKVDFKSIPRNQKSSNLDLISRRNQDSKWREILGDRNRDF